MQKDPKIAGIENEIRHIVDTKDLQKDKELDVLKSRNEKVSNFSKLMAYNRPLCNIFIGLFVSILQGSLMPLIGALMAKMLFVLMDVHDLDDMRTESNKWCLCMLGLATIALFTGFC